MATEVTREQAQERQWAMLCHLSGFAGYVIPFGNILGPLLVWQLKKNEFPSVEAPGKEALNFQISILIYAAVSALLTFVLIGIPLLVVVGLASLVLPIVAGLKANDGQAYRYPYIIRLVT